MAKALIGHLRSDQRVPSRVSLDNQRLRRRVCDLETLVLQVQLENDRLRLENERLVAERSTPALESEMLPA
ncbi:MAG: hypothetical protein JWN68_1412 [Nocardioides sp.]|jgi:hypothetical protein|uniref:hypothetical protein n=1 Tax=Nocardioides sp. TaxID=35761 RepID=UPI00260AD167|nr:hypothetical protein [Nocardioides sp.]MCW2833459.1 hypothetical protein [Nocardioides sp.]